MDAKQIRKNLIQSGVDIEFNVRKWKDGSVWVIPRNKLESNKLCSALIDLGYKSSVGGKGIIDVYSY